MSWQLSYVTPAEYEQDLELEISVLMIQKNLENNGMEEVFNSTAGLYFMSSYLYDLWPLLLTWFNFNPSMDK